MHPLLTIGLANSLSNERIAAAKTRRTAKAAKQTPGAAAPAGVAIRRARATDVLSPHTS